MEYSEKSYNVYAMAHNVLRTIEVLHPGMAGLTAMVHQWAGRPLDLELDWC